MTETLMIEGAVDAPPSVRDLVPQDRRLLPAPMERLQEVANMLAAAGGLVPKELRGKTDVCLAVAYMAALHGTDPVATASQTYVVGDKIAFMAQYINAIIRPHLAGPPEYRFEGEGAQRFVTVLATPREGGAALIYSSPRVGQITPKNSPLWKSDPDQQLCYYSIRAWARRHMPGVLLGIYAVEELQQIVVKDVTPPPPDVFGDDTDIDDLPEAELVGDEQTFEPSGGYATDTVPVEEPPLNDPEPRRIALHDDPMEFFAVCKQDVAEASTRKVLAALWKATEPDRKALFAADRASSDELDALFTARHNELPA